MVVFSRLLYKMCGSLSVLSPHCQSPNLPTWTEPHQTVRGNVEHLLLFLRLFGDIDLHQDSAQATEMQLECQIPYSALRGLWLWQIRPQEPHLHTCDMFALFHPEGVWNGLLTAGRAPVSARCW